MEKLYEKNLKKFIEQNFAPQVVGSETVYNVKQIVSERYERMAKDKHLTYIFANNASNVITVIDNQGNQVKYEGEPKTAYLLKEANR